MSNQSKYEYLQDLRFRYDGATKQQKQAMLDEFCTVCGYNRKYAIRLLNTRQPSRNRANLSKRGHKKIYGDPLIVQVLRDLWIATNLPCSKNLKAIIPLWLPHYENYILTQEIKDKLLRVSAATIDRLIKPFRTKYGKTGLATTKPGSIIKKQIPIKTNQWDESVPGFIEADTVAHCGNSTAGGFVFSLNCVDIATGWTEQRAVWGKGQTGVLNAIQHIENKNWTHIRQYLGYQRFQNPSLVDKLNDLYTTEWNLYFNFFIPSVKLIDKTRIGSKIVKTYDKPKTPLQRLLESQHISTNDKQTIEHKFKQLNPFKLQQQMSFKIKKIIKDVTHFNNLES